MQLVLQRSDLPPKRGKLADSKASERANQEAENQMLAPSESGPKECANNC
jgi:hypothetical protein